MTLFSILGGILLFVLKGILWLFVAVLVLGVIVLVTPMKVGVIYPETTVFVSWNGIKYTIYPMKPKKKKKASWLSRFRRPKRADTLPREVPPVEALPGSAKPQPVPAETQAPQAVPGETRKKKSFDYEQFKTIMKILEITLHEGKKTMKGIVFQHLYGELTVGNYDKAKAAMEYGAVATAITLLNDSFNRVFTIKRQKINVAVDFSADSYRWSCDFIVYFRPYRAVIAAVVAYIKIKKEGINLWQILVIF